MPKSKEVNPMTAGELAEVAAAAHRTGIAAANEDDAPQSMEMAHIAAAYSTAASIVAAIDRHREATERLRQAVDATASAVRGLASRTTSV